jgi:ATP-binding cassette subfamily B protein
VGFVGETGSGKSTLVDLFMGLLKPTSGKLLIDGQPLEGEIVPAWQKTIAHVPQNIYLMDASVAENIAFGVPKAKINVERMKQAAKQAQIAEFIETLPDEYQTSAGERGIRFSGGQRQRIGIARALYKQATVLVLDEATSALDDSTQESVMDAIEGLDRELTILIISHRMSTLRRCDEIYRLNSGRLITEVLS